VPVGVRPSPACWRCVLTEAEQSKWPAVQHVASQPRAAAAFLPSAPVRAIPHGALPHEGPAPPLPQPTAAPACSRLFGCRRVLTLRALFWDGREERGRQQGLGVKPEVQRREEGEGEARAERERATEAVVVHASLTGAVWLPKPLQPSPA
jgi:hypothetical protein